MWSRIRVWCPMFWDRVEIPWILVCLLGRIGLLRMLYCSSWMRCMGICFLCIRNRAWVVFVACVVCSVKVHTWCVQQAWYTCLLCNRMCRIVVCWDMLQGIPNQWIWFVYCQMNIVFFVRYCIVCLWGGKRNVGCRDKK